MSENSNTKIAVIGLGAQGLVAVKNLLEEGFDVTGFEKNHYVGGIWHYSALNQISALPTTIVNVSKERSCFTDFPYPDECDSFPTSAEVDQYLNNYCDHFKLRPHLHLGATIEAVNRDEVRDCWALTVKLDASEVSERLYFDKLVVAIGPHSVPIEPQLQHRNRFKGKILHSVAFKDSSQFKRDRVLVVGASNTAADTSTSLIGTASKVYFSHRNGSVVAPRYLKNGHALDHGFTYRLSSILGMIGRSAPALVKGVMNFMVKNMTRAEFGSLDPQWRLTPAPSLQHQVPTVSDTLIPALRAGTIVSTAAPCKIVGNYDVELEDGEIVQVDSIIFCTGYESNFSILGQHDPTLTLDGTHDHYTPRLYQNIISLENPNTLAFVGLALVFLPAFLMSDLSSMALAQLWSARSTSPPLPSSEEMHTWHLQHVRWMSSVRATHPTKKAVKFSVPDETWTYWVAKTAGANLEENLSWTSFKAWKLWWNDRTFCNLLMDGVFVSPLYRLFESDRRRQWNGAREAIEKMNEKAKKDVEGRRRLASSKREEKVFLNGG